ncbi:MAG: MFS transporter [Candidatus Binatia bacterium]
MQQQSIATSEPLFTRRFWLACGVHFCGAMAMSLYILFPLVVRHLGGSEFVIGIYAGMTGAAAVLARLPVGRWLDTLGRHRVLTIAGLLHVTAWCGFLSIGTLGMRSAFFVVVYGLASGSLFATYFTYASDITPVSRRSEGIALFAIWGMLPNGLGPFLGELLISRAGFHAYFLVAAAFACLSLCLSQLLPETARPVTKVPADQLPRMPSVRSRGLLFVLGTTFMFGAAVNGVFTFMAPFAQSRGRGAVGGFFMSYAFAAVAVRVVTGRLPDRIGLIRVLIPALLLYAAGVLLVPHISGVPTLILVGAMCGAGHGYAFPIFSVLAIEQVSSARRGRAVSWLTAMFDLGNTVANPLLGAIAQWAGYRVMFTVVACGVLSAAVAVWWKGGTLLTGQTRTRGGA